MKHAVQILCSIALLTLIPARAAGTEPPKPTCALAAAPPMNFIISGASINTVWLRPSTPACADLMINAGQLSLARPDGATISGTTSCTSKTAPCDVVAVALANVGALEVGSSEWTVRSGAASEDLGRILLQTVSVQAKQLVVSYDDGFLDAKQVGLADSKNDDWIAVARKIEPEQESEPKPEPVRIFNTAEITATGPIMQLESTNGLQMRRFEWWIRDSTWGSSVRFHCEKRVPRKLTGMCKVRLDRVQFRVNHRFKTPLVARVDLLEAGSKPRTAPALVSFPLKLADQARLESLPIPLWMVASVSCDNYRLFRADTFSTAQHGGSIAIDDDALRRSACSLELDYRRLSHVAPRLARFLDVYGNQPLQVTVRRGDKEVTWQTAVSPSFSAAVSRAVPPAVSPPVPPAAPTPTSVPQPEVRRVPLPEPPGAADETGPYTITVKFHSGASEVFLRKGSVPETTEPTDPETYFTATLRPRGRFGLTYPVRTYITFPVTPLTIRTPPRVSDLRTSSESPVLQLEAVRVGMMAVLEPWNYDDDRNPSPLPLSFQAGLSVLRTTDDPISPSFRIGVSIDFPIIDKAVTESSLAIGFFYEVDLEETPLSQNDAFVVTVGFDFLRVAKTNQDSE
jgi:hypothetical protein